MVATSRNTNWSHLENLVHMCGPDAELHIRLENVSPDADGTPDHTVVVLKCRAGFIRSGDHLFVVPDFPSGGACGRLQPNIWKLVPTDEADRYEAECLTDCTDEGCRPNVPKELVEKLEEAGFHWEEFAPRD